MQSPSKALSSPTANPPNTLKSPLPSSPYSPTPPACDNNLIRSPTVPVSDAELDKQIAKILGTKDPLDGKDFDPIEYINAIFPTGLA